MTTKNRKTEKETDQSIQLIILGQVESEEITEEKAAFDAAMEVMWFRNMSAGALHMANFVAGFYLSQTVENM